MSVDLKKSMKKWHCKAMDAFCLTERGADLFVNPTFRATQTIIDTDGAFFPRTSEFDSLKDIFRCQLEIELDDYCLENNIATFDESILLDFVEQSPYFKDEALHRFKTWQNQHQTLIEEKVAVLLFLTIINW